MSTAFERRLAVHFFIAHLLRVLQNGDDAILIYHNLGGEDFATIQFRRFNPADRTEYTGKSFLDEDVASITASCRSLERLTLRIQPLGHETSSFVGSAKEGGARNNIKGVITFAALDAGLEQRAPYSDISQLLQQLIAIVDGAILPNANPGTIFDA